MGTASSFADMFLELVPPGITSEIQQNFIKKMVKHQIIYATLDCRFLGMTASEVAFTATYNATVVTAGSRACQAAYRNLQQSINVSLLPIKLESALLAEVQSSGILSDFLAFNIPASTVRTRKSSSKSSSNHHLSPRCITMSR